MWYFYHSVGLQCFCQCTWKDYLSIYNTSLNETKMGSVVIHQKRLLTKLPSSCLLPNKLLISTYFCGFQFIWGVEMTRRCALKWPEDCCLILRKPQRAYCARKHSCSMDAHTHIHTERVIPWGWIHHVLSQSATVSHRSRANFSGEMHSLTTWSPVEHSRLLTALQHGFV